MNSEPIEDGATVGLCGLGNMGHAIASRLVGRWKVMGCDLGEEQRDHAAVLGVQASSEPRNLADAGVVLLSLPSPKASLTVAAELLRVLAPGSIIVETSTVTPADITALGQLCAEHGIHVVDGAILSGVAQMQHGRATLLLGGDIDVLARVGPVLEQISERTLHLGGLGTGMAAKVVNNAVAHGVMVLLVEAMAMSKTAGIDLTTVAQLLADPEGGLTRPLTHRVMERIFSGDYDGGMPLEAARKDSLLALEMARAAQLPLFVLPAAHTVYDLAATSGLARADYAAIAKLWEQWLDIDLRSSGP